MEVFLNEPKDCGHVSIKHLVISSERIFVNFATKTDQISNSEKKKRYWNTHEDSGSIPS